MERQWWSYLLAAESIFFLLFWLVNPYIAWLLTWVLAPVFLAAFFIAGLAELIEKSRVERSLFSFLWWMGIVPLLWALLFVYLDDFSFSWLHAG